MELLSQISGLRKAIFFFILQLVLSFILFASFWGQRNIVWNYVQKGGLFENNDKPVESSSKLNNVTLIILLWTWPFGSQFPLNQCPNQFNANDCFFTVNRSIFSDANAVALHHRDVCNSKNQLPQIQRPSKQYWIWLNMESATHSPNLGFMDNLINLTISFRADSDIFSPYGWLEKNSDTDSFNIPKKTKFVAWVVSHWNPNHRRVQYYQELKKYIQIDVYGMNKMQLPRENHTIVLSTYKFYLAFENSIHQDYITEKLWSNSFMSGTVPVVIGPPRENYERFIPPDSFIHVDDFKTPKDLASYLIELDKDDSKYHQYFNWRSRFHPETSYSMAIHYCKMCKALKEAPAYRTFPSIAKWYK